MFDVKKRLRETSRTFALAIPLLPDPLEKEIGLSYLLFRVADTLEDADQIDFATRAGLLAEFAETCQAGSSTECWCRLSSQWLRYAPFQDAEHEDLLRETPQLIEQINQLPKTVQDILFEHVAESAMGMRKFMLQADGQGRFQLQSTEELQSYCYYVAGIVGKMLTSLFLEKTDLSMVANRLQRLAPKFGEGLQLVNILKDREEDRNHGRQYLPDRVELSEVVLMTRHDLTMAEEYSTILETNQADKGIVEFTRFPTFLAQRTLDYVEELGAGAKVPRSEVKRILANVQGT